MKTTTITYEGRALYCASTVPRPQYTATARRGYAGDCKHCGAPTNPYKEKCDYCGCYY